MYFKIYETQNMTVLACCDKKILGKKLKEGKYDVEVTESFYKGEETDEEKLSLLLDEVQSINLFGNKAVGVALKKGLISESDVITIKGVKHAIIMRL